MDLIRKHDYVDIELDSGNIHRSWMTHSIGKNDALANAFGVRVFRGGYPVDLEGAVCEGFFRNAEGTNILITETAGIEGNIAYVALPQACYNVEGQFCLAIKLIGGGVTGTMRIVDGMVDNTNTSSPVAPTETVPTYQEILAVYAEMQEAVDNYDDVVAAQDAKIENLNNLLDLEINSTRVENGLSRLSSLTLGGINTNTGAGNTTKTLCRTLVTDNNCIVRYSDPNYKIRLFYYDSQDSYLGSPTKYYSEVNPSVEAVNNGFPSNGVIRIMMRAWDVENDTIASNPPTLTQAICDEMAEKYLSFTNDYTASQYMGIIDENIRKLMESANTGRYDLINLLNVTYYKKVMITSSGEVIQGQIDSNDSYVIPIMLFDSITVTARGVSKAIAFLTSDELTVGEDAPLCDGTTRITGGSGTYAVPADAKYLFVAYHNTGGSNLKPSGLTGTYKTAAQIEDNTARLDALYTSMNKGVVFNYNLADENAYSDFVNADTTKITENGYVPDAGWENRVTIDKYIVADYIAVNYEISITGTPTIVVGSIDSGYTTSKHATLIRINFDAGTVEYLTGSSGSGGGNIDGATIPAYTYETLELVNLNGTEYRVEIGRKNRCPYVRITNLKTGTVCCDDILTIYETDSSYGGKAGAMYDFPVFGTINGTCCFKRTFCTVSANYDVVFIGDSITEGSQLAVDDVWANKVIASDFVKSGLNCGRGGGNINNALRCVSDILPAIMPKMVVVTIGTNGGNTLAKLTTLIEGIKRLGALPIINCIPMLSSGSPSTNETILTLDTIHCRFDIATAINNDVTEGQDTSLFFNDKTHPNVAGGIALYNNFMANVGSYIQV